MKVELWGWCSFSDFTLSPSNGTSTEEFRHLNDVTFAHNVFSFDSETTDFINR